MGGSKSPSSTTQTQKVDPWLKGQIAGNLGTIQGLQPYQPYSANQAIAPINPEMQNVLNTQQQLGQQGVGMLGQGAEALQGVAGFTPQQIAMQGQVTPDQVSAGQANLDPFSNPYQSQVVDQTIQDMDRARQLAVNRGEDAALSAGAFGGSRHGIADSETNRAFADRTGALVGQLNQQGFNTALQAAQNQQGMDLQAGLANQQAGMGAQQFNIGTDLAAQQANQGAGLDASRLNLLGGQALAGQGMNQFGLGQQAAQYGQNYDQGIRDFNFQQYQQAFNDPRVLAQMETAAVQGIPFMGTTSGTSQQPSGSGVGSAIGGGLSGAAMGAQIGGPYGAAIGGGLGLLGGMFG